MACEAVEALRDLYLAALDTLVTDEHATRVGAALEGARRVLDQHSPVTDFGNGLQMRTTERGVEFRVLQAPDGHWPGTAWTPGISREELAAFLSGEPPL